MKKAPLRYWFAMLLIFLTASILLNSCKSKKPTVETNENVKDSSSYVSISDHKKEVNKAVADSIAKLLPLIKTGDKNCDSICNEKCNDLLKQINFYKKSGDNNYKLYFDEKNRNLSFVANLQETISELKNKTETKERFFTKTKTITITKRVTFIPFWVKVLAWIGGIASLFLAWRFGRIFI